MPLPPTHHIPQTLIGLVVWLWWAAGAFAYSNTHPANGFATTCLLVSTSYNTAGDTTTDGHRNYTYNSQQRLASTNPAKTNYLYNALGQRVFKTDPIFGTPTADNQKLGWAYIYDETGTLLGEYGMGGAASSGSTEHIYLPTAAGPLPVATVINGQHYAVHTDHLNTPRRLTAANNQAVWQWAYSAFGQEPATTANKRFTSANTIPATGTTTTQPVAYHQRYPGQSFDVESGLHYNYFRSYDPQIGRYTQPDPIGLDGGWNRYVYAENNPLGKTDRFGLSPEDAEKIKNAINQCVTDLTNKGLRSNKSAFNNYMPGKLDCGEQTEAVNKCLGNLKLTDRWYFYQRAGFGHSWGLAVSSNPQDPPIWFDPKWNNQSQGVPCETCQGWLGRDFDKNPIWPLPPYAVDVPSNPPLIRLK